MVIPSSLHEDFPYNNDGSSYSMESIGILWMMKRLHTVMGVGVYYSYIVSDDATSMSVKYIDKPKL